MWAGVQESFPIQSLSTLALIYCFVVMVAAYMARGASGFGAAVAMPLLGLVVPLKILVPAWTLIGIAAGVALLGEDRKNVSWREMAKLVPGCLVGIAVGLYVFTLLTSETLAKWLGVMVLLYGLYSLVGTFRADVKPKLPPAVAAGARRLRRRHHRHRGRHHGQRVLRDVFRRHPPRQGAIPRHHDGDPADADGGARHRLLGGRRVHPRGADRGGDAVRRRC